MLEKLRQILTAHEKKEFLLLTVCLAILSVSEVFGIAILIPLIGMFLKPDFIHTSKVIGALYRFSGLSDTTHFLVILMIAAVVFFILKSLYSVFMLYWQQNFISKIHIRLTRAVLSHYLYKPYGFHLMSNSSVLFKNIIAEVGQFTSSLLGPMLSLYSECIILAGIFIFLASLYPVITLLIAFSLGLFVAGFNFFFKKRLKGYAEQRAMYSEEMYKTALESLNAVKEIKVYDRQEFFLNNFCQAVKKYCNGFTKSMVVSGLPRNFLEVALFSGLTLSIVISVCTRKDYTELIPMLLIIGVAAMKITPSISKISANINSMHYSFNSLDMVSDIMRDYRFSGCSAEPVGNLHINDVSDAIALKNISFCYEATKNYIFENINISVPLHKITGIVGETGSGKSTLIDIIMGLLVPSKGDLYYHGILIDQTTVGAYRQNIGYVPQAIFLLDDTIAANIAFGIPHDKMDRQKVEEVVKLAQLDNFVKGSPRGLDSNIGERGVRISGGQRQRIGIARALYRDPEVLILDEATSALDGNSEAEIIDVIKNMRNAGMSVVIVAHRLSAISNADLIYVMDHGKIAAHGSFKDLNDNSDIFNSIVHKKVDSKIGEPDDKPEEEITRQ